jgi:two-component system sensor histidine kinase KdpD
MAEALLNKVFRSKLAGYGSAVFGIALTTAALEPIHLQISVATVALALLLVVLFVATGWGSRPAFVASILGVLCFNFFFLPPVGTWTVADPENWFALAAFLITAVTAGQLSASVKRRAEEAEAGKKEIERLYKELSDAFEMASQAEALKRSEKLKSALLDAVTHDIRTPLTSIKASVTTLLDEQKDASFNGVQIHLDAETRRDMLEVINEESDRLNRFVEGLIELAQIEAGEMRLRRQWDAISEIIGAVLSRVEPLVRQHKILIEAEKDLPVIKVDSRHVSEVLYTLIDNAAKYSSVGTTIRIAARRFDDANVLIAVEDEGQGIPPPLRERVFDKFFRATRDGGDTGTLQPTGSGMGLAIAKGIIEAHDGRIWIADGARENGTRFEFTLPIGDDAETANEQSAAAVEKAI